MAEERAGMSKWDAFVRGMTGERCCLLQFGPTEKRSARNSVTRSIRFTK